MLATQSRTGELATFAMAAKAKASVEARYAIAFHPANRRKFAEVRENILAACRRPEFAEVARYKKPIGSSTIEGFSIRFAEEMIKSLRNINCETTTVHEDSEQKIVMVSVTDLEANITISKEISVAKTVERKQLKAGQVALSERENSLGQKVYLVEASEDEINVKISAAESKAIRTSGLRLVPSDLLEEAEKTILETLSSGGADPKATVRKLCDAFASMNIRSAELEKYLGHSLDTVSPKQVADLRAIFQAIKEGSASWSEFSNGEETARITKPAIAKSPKATKDQPPIETTTTPVAAEPVKEPSKPVAKSEASDEPVAMLISFAENNGISLASFSKWFGNKYGRADEAAQWKEFTDVPVADATMIISTPATLKAIKLICAS